MSFNPSDFIANRTRHSNHEFGKLIPKLPLADLFLIEVKRNKDFWCRLIRVLSPVKLIFECVICYEEIPNPKELILHLNGAKHANKVKDRTNTVFRPARKQLFHPVYTFNKNEYVFSIGSPDSQDATPENRQKAIRSAEIKMNNCPKSYFLFAHSMATRVENYVRNLGESIPRNDFTLEFSAQKIIDEATPEEINETELTLQRRDNTDVSKKRAIYERLVKLVAEGESRKNKSRKTLKQKKLWAAHVKRKEKLKRLEKQLGQMDDYVASDGDDDAGGDRDAGGDGDADGNSDAYCDGDADADGNGLKDNVTRTAGEKVLPIRKTPHMSMESLAGLIGVEYVVRLIDSDNKGEDSCMWYVCTLCDKRLNSVAMHDHILDCNHRYLYCMEHYATCMDQYFSYVSISTEAKREKTMKNIVTVLANVIESHHGRALPYYCHASEYNNNPDAIKHVTHNADHASQENGPTFFNHIRRKEIEDLPYRTFLMSSLNDSKVARHFNRLPENSTYIGKPQIPGISGIPPAIECDQNEHRDVRLREAWESSKVELESSPRYQKPPVAAAKNKNNNNENGKRKKQKRSRSPPKKRDRRNVNDNFQPNSLTQSSGDKRASRRGPEIIPTLRLMTAFEDLLGSLGPKVMDLFSETLAIGKIKPRQLNSNFLTFENCMLLETAVEKLKGVLESEPMHGQKLVAINNVIRQTTDLIASSDNMLPQNPPSLPSDSALPSMDSIPPELDAEAVLSAASLASQGKSDLLSPYQLQQLMSFVEFSRPGGNIKSSNTNRSTSASSNTNQNYTRPNYSGRDMNYSTMRSTGRGGVDGFDSVGNSGSSGNFNSTFSNSGGNNYRSGGYGGTGGNRSSNYPFGGSSTSESTLFARRDETYNSKSGSSGYHGGNNFNTNMRGNNNGGNFTQSNYKHQEFSQNADRYQNWSSNSYNSQKRGNEFFNSSKQDGDGGSSGSGSNAMLHLRQNWNRDQQNYNRGGGGGAGRSNYSGNWGNN